MTNPRSRAVKLIPIVFVGLVCLAPMGFAQSSDEAGIRTLTMEFCNAIVAGDLSGLDKVFDTEASNVYYDINEGMVGFNRLRQVWQAATGNYNITRFEFGPDMKITVKGTEAVQTGSWRQTQVARSGGSRDISGRATILWKKTPAGWRVYHYHASVTPRGR
jgi:ketosteroid isomerase-like protein